MMSAEDQLDDARALLRKGHFSEALAIANAVVAAAPDYADAWGAVGSAAQSLKKYPESLAALREMIRLTPRFGEGWVHYGLVLAESGQKAEAKKAFYHAIKLNPNLVVAHRQLAQIYKEEEDHDMQILHLTAVDDLEEANGNDLNLLGIAHWSQKHYADAIEYYLRSAKISKNYAPYYNLALVYKHPEVSQDVDAVDSLKRALSYKADFQKAITMHTELTQVDSTGRIGRLFQLAQEVVKEGEILLRADEYFQFYINPLEMVEFHRERSLEDLDTKQIQRLKKALLQEIELEDGVIQSLDGFVLDKSRAIGLCEELLDPRLKRFHWQVLKNPFLHFFMTRGDVRHFLATIDSSFPLGTLETLDEDEFFRRWLSEPFARQYDLVLSRAIEQGSVSIVESLFDGRRWVLPEHDEICFAGAHRLIDRRLEPLRNAVDQAKEVEPKLPDIQDILKQHSLARILNLLPMYFRDQQSEAVRYIREIAIAAYNVHGNTDLSEAILRQSKLFVFKSVELSHRLKDDFKKIEELIQTERKHEAKLTLGNKPMEVTKDGVRQGERFLPVAHIRSIRWGITVTGYQHAPVYEFLMAFRDKDLSEVVFSWSASNDLKLQENHFHKLVEAALIYIVPKIVIKVQEGLERREQFRAGSCTMKHEGVVFETQGWFSTKTHLVPWSNLATELESGQLIVYDRANPKTRTTMPLREAENAFVLQYLSSAEN